MDTSALSEMTSIFDVLRRRRPDVTREISNRYPTLAHVASGKRMLGEVDGKTERDADKGPLLFAVGDAALEDARTDLGELTQVLNRRAQNLARLRLCSGMLTALTTAGVLAAVLTQNDLELATASLAFVCALLGLVSGYLEDPLGGDGSVAKARDVTSRDVGRLAEAEGMLRLAKVLADNQKALAALAILNEVLAGTQVMRARFNLAI